MAEMPVHFPRWTSAGESRSVRSPLRLMRDEPPADFLDEMRMDGVDFLADGVAKTTFRPSPPGDSP
jgi:hypothetical protein